VRQAASHRAENHLEIEIYPAPSRVERGGRCSVDDGVFVFFNSPLNACLPNSYFNVASDSNLIPFSKRFLNNPATLDLSALFGTSASTIDANGEITNYLYSSGEKMLTLSDVDALTEFFLKDGTTLMKQYADGKILINYKSGKPLYEVEENNWYIYDEDGNKITSENETVTDIKKIN